MKRFPLLIAVLALVLVILACGETTPTSAPSASPEIANTQPPSGEQATDAPEPTEPLEPTNTPEPTATSLPTDTPSPTNTPEPEYQDPVIILELDGVGEVVSDNYELPQCWKVVTYWSAATNSYGSASLIVHLHNVQDGTEHSIINEFAMDVDSLSESVLSPLKGGEYYFSTENTDEAWAIRMECQDKAEPIAIGLDLQGSGNIVTDNYELHQCQKSVFVWNAEPDDNGTASLIVHLCKDGADNCVSLVNEFDMDLTKTLTGEALQALSGGNYFFAIENTSGRPWGIRWECRD